MSKRKATVKCANCGRWIIVWGASRYSNQETRWKHANGGNVYVTRRTRCGSPVPVT